MSLLLTRRSALASFAGLIADGPRTAPRAVQIGTTQVRLIAITGGKGLTYFHPHEDEHTSAVTTRSVVHQLGGSLLEIRSGGSRLISFHLAGVLYTFDPNRIFTDIGIVKSLIQNGHDSQAAVNAIKPLRAAILASLKRSGSSWVSVHNNTLDGSRVTQYQPGNPYSDQAKKITTNPRANPHDFFLVLEDKLYTQLAERGFNVVQFSDSPSDDGSLPVYCQQHRIRYVNIEAAEGHGPEQRRMIDTLQTLLK